MSLTTVDEVEFEAEKEGWNVYETSDGTVLRIKTVLVKLFSMGDGARREYSANFQNIMTVLKAKPEIKAPKGEPPSSPWEVRDRPRIEVQFTALNEDWNVYRLEAGDRLRVKLVATLIERVGGAWDQYGDPLYLVISTNVIQPVRRRGIGPGPIEGDRT